ncbi:MAG: DNA mismatch repair protein MutS [Anaerolineae bacterium]
MMKVFFLYSDRDFDASQPLPPNAADLMQDLALNTLFSAMAQEDEFLFQIVQQVVLSSLDDVAPITYRQEILRDCLQHPDVVRQIYQIPLEFLARKRKQWLWISPRHSSPSHILSSARNLLEASLDLLRRLRYIADENVTAFKSRGFRRFFTMIQQELDDEYLAVVEQHIRMLRFRRGVWLRAQPGKGNEGAGYVFCKPNDDQRWFQRLLLSRSPTYSYSLPPRDDAGARVLGELRDRGTVRAANAVAQAAEHVESFFNVLRWELAFYMGCLNLHEQLTALGEPVTFPQPVPADRRRFSCVGLYNPTLALTMGRPVVGNNISAENKPLVAITGPNRGGKTTFLRSVGLAQLMMQSGMFVAAESFSANLCTGLFTHFKREEDKTMESGKFEEELKRMSAIVDCIKPNALVLLNESFAATNEREGSEIARQIVSALLEKRTKVFYVTFLHEFARHFYERAADNTVFLRAERLPDGTRTFRLKEARPLETSYGIDLYRKIFQPARVSSEEKQR